MTKKLKVPKKRFLVLFSEEAVRPLSTYQTDVLMAPLSNKYCFENDAPIAMYKYVKTFENRAAAQKAAKRG